MPDAPPLEPASPDDYGLPPADLTTEAMETAHHLAEGARAEPTALGFSDAQIEAWAASYLFELGEGSVRDLLGWMTAMQDID